MVYLNGDEFFPGKEMTIDAKYCSDGFKEVQPFDSKRKKTNSKEMNTLLDEISHHLTKHRREWGFKGALRYLLDPYSGKR